MTTGTRTGLNAHGCDPARNSRPLLRGHAHARPRGDLAAPQRLSLLVYGLGAVLLFAVSASYHPGPWPPHPRALLRRGDHALIGLMLAAGYTPLALTLPGAAGRTGLLVGGVWALTGGGAPLVVTSLSRVGRVTLYGALAALGGQGRD